MRNSAQILCNLRTVFMSISVLCSKKSKTSKFNV
nr:MAG TPA: hypothetical protein [Caudoviricetes sp.]